MKEREKIEEMLDQHILTQQHLRVRSRENLPWFVNRQPVTMERVQIIRLLFLSPPSNVSSGN